MASKKSRKPKFDLSQEAIRPFYASVGAADVAFSMVRDYVGDSTKRLSSASEDVTTFVDDLQKTVTDLATSDPKELAEALKAIINDKVAALQKDAKDRQDTMEAVVSSIGKDYKSYPALAQSLLVDSADKAGKNYEELAERGESLVTRLLGQASDVAEQATDETKEAFADVVDDVKGAAKKSAGAAKKAPAKKTPAKKASATKAPATKASATKAPAKKTPATKASATKAPATKTSATKAAAKKTSSAKAPAKAAQKPAPAKAAPAKAASTPTAGAKPAAAKPAATSTAPATSTAKSETSTASAKSENN